MNFIQFLLTICLIGLFSLIIYYLVKNKNLSDLITINSGDWSVATNGKGRVVEKCIKFYLPAEKVCPPCPAPQRCPPCPPCPQPVKTCCPACPVH